MYIMPLYKWSRLFLWTARRMVGRGWEVLQEVLMDLKSMLYALDKLLLLQRSARVVFSSSRREFLWFNLAHRDETENFWHLISGFETRPRKISFNLGHRDEIKIYCLHSQASRREREFPWYDLGFREENDNSKSCHLSLNSGLNVFTIL